MISDEKTYWQKIYTEWVFNQSTGIVVGLLALALSQYQNFRLEKRIETLETQLHEQTLYERNLLLKQIENTTKCLDDNTNALNDFRNFSKR